MTRFLFSLFLVFAIGLFISCKSKKDTCGGCPEGQTCTGFLYEHCYPTNEVYKLNGQQVVVQNGYFGVAKNTCFDTLVFYEDTLQMGNLRFGLFIANPTLRDLGLNLFDKTGTDIYRFTTGGDVCNINGEGIRPFIIANLKKDSSYLEIRLQDINPDGFRDTVFVNLSRR
jgi:hypothetical protein